MVPKIDNSITRSLTKESHILENFRAVLTNRARQKIALKWSLKRVFVDDRTCIYTETESYLRVLFVAYNYFKIVVTEFVNAVRNYNNNSRKNHEVVNNFIPKKHQIRNDECKKEM